jgi:hypothetical protein
MPAFYEILQRGTGSLENPAAGVPPIFAFRPPPRLPPLQFPRNLLQ